MVQLADNSLRLEEIKLQREQLALRQAELVADHPAKMLKVAAGYMEMLQRIDMYGTTEELVIKDALMNGLGMMGGNSSLQQQLTGSQQAVATGNTLLTITEYLTLHYNKTIPSRDLTTLGKEVATCYRQEVADEFPALHVKIEQKMQTAGGRQMMVNAYGSQPVGPGKRSGQQIVHDVLLERNMIPE